MTRLYGSILNTIASKQKQPQQKKIDADTDSKMAVHAIPSGALSAA